MEIVESKISSKFQLTIPKLVREKLGLDEGDILAFLIEDKNVMVVPKTDDALEAMKKLAGGKRFPHIHDEIKAARKEW